MSAQDDRPILIVPYMWVGDFVRCHTVVSLARARWPHRPIDLLSSGLCAPLARAMPGVRQPVIVDLPRRRIAVREQWRLATVLRERRYATALVMPRTWKAALAPFLAGIPKRTGFVGEMRFGLLNDLRWNERALPRMIDQCTALAVPRGAPLPHPLPPPELRVADSAVAAWRARRGVATTRPVVALCPGSAKAEKRWPIEHFAALAQTLTSGGTDVWIIGGPDERAAAARICADPSARDLTGGDLHDAMCALASAKVVVANDSGLLHVAAALGTPTVALFGPTDPALHAPLNPLAALVEAPSAPGAPDVGHRRMSDIMPDKVLHAVTQALLA
jgi:heptosyltransferase-2